MAGRILRSLSVLLVACTIALTTLLAPGVATAATSDILRPGDFPTGWRTAPVLPSDSTAPATPACAALGRQQRTSIVTVGTPKFVDGQASSPLDVVAATVTTMPSSRAAKQQVTALLSRRLLQCLVDAANARFASAQTEATTVVHRITIPHAGGHVRAVEAKTTVTGSHPLTFTQDVVFVQDGARIATLHVERDEHADYRALRNRLVLLVERRLRDGGATNV